MSKAHELDSYLEAARTELATASTPQARLTVEKKYLGRKGKLAAESKKLSTLSGAERKTFGAAYNRVRAELTELFAGANSAEPTGSAAARGAFDVTMPGTPIRRGHRHPVSLVLDDIADVFGSLGFGIAEGPEVEDDWHNFTALNIPPDHPGRDMQDTFYVAGSKDRSGVYRLLPRTQTSSVQIRYMEEHRPPLRIIAPGKVYRNETEDATHSAVFHQVEGLMVDETTSFADLKGILELVVRHLLGDEARLRFRPSYFPFTEPSAEIDVSVPAVRDGEWLELAGAGMVHPEVLRNVKIHPQRYQGFAFGFGVERIAMLKYGLEDLRPFFRPDIRLLEQF